MIDHDAQHGAEIACLRDLYRVTDGLRLPVGRREGRDLEAPYARFRTRIMRLQRFPLSGL